MRLPSSALPTLTARAALAPSASGSGDRVRQSGPMPWRMTSAGNRWRLNEIGFAKYLLRRRLAAELPETF